MAVATGQEGGAVGIKTTSEAGVGVLRIEGDLVAATAPEFRKAAEEGLAQNERDFVVDFEAATGIDSAGLEALTWLERACRERMGGVRLCHLNIAFQTILEITRLGSRFESCESVEAAIAGFG